MTHADAESTQAVERYLLGELSSDERDQFEAHLFDCIACAEDLKAGAMFVDASRAVLREGPLRVVEEKPSRGWFAWLWPGAMPAYGFAAAFMLLLGFSLYQNVVVLPALRNSSAPRALSAFSFVSSGTRGATPLVIEAPARQPFLLFFDIPPGGRSASYHCAIVAADGGSRVAVDVSAAQARDTVQLFVPASGLATGPYTLIITGVAGAEGSNQEIARYPFVLHGGS